MARRRRIEKRETGGGDGGGVQTAGRLGCFFNTLVY